VRRLVDFPYVLVRLRCDLCKRAGAYRLARLAVKFGSEILLDDLVLRLSADCPWRDDPRGSRCGAYFADLPPRRPPPICPCESDCGSLAAAKDNRGPGCHGARLMRSSPKAGCSAPLRPDGDRAAFRGWL
jgi:hypothetical protein